MGNNIDLKKHFDKIVLINLVSRPDRLKESYEEFGKWGIDSTCIEVVQAVDGNTLPPHPSISKGALGLYHTHLNILKEAKAQGVKNVLFIEDDISFREQIKYLDAFMEEIPSDAALIYLGAHHIQKPLRASARTVRNIQAFTTHSFAMSSSIFDVVINDLENLNNLDMQIDLYYSSKIQREYPTYSFFPNVTSQRKSFSDIEMRECDYSDNMDENLNV